MTYFPLQERQNASLIMLSAFQSSLTLRFVSAPSSFARDINGIRACFPRSKHALRSFGILATAQAPSHWTILSSHNNGIRTSSSFIFLPPHPQNTAPPRINTLSLSFSTHLITLSASLPNCAFSRSMAFSSSLRFSFDVPSSSDPRFVCSVRPATQ